METIDSDGTANRRLAARHTLRLLRSRKQTGSLLEIGAGMGFFRDEACSKGYTPRAIELNRTQEEHIQSLGMQGDFRGGALPSSASPSPGWQLEETGAAQSRTPQSNENKKPIKPWLIC